VSTTVDRALVLRLLLDESLSYREIARRANCSDWSVRFIAREVDADRLTDDLAEPCEPLTATEWWIFGGIVVLIVGGVCFAAWRMPSFDGGPME
jgi:hypothetical protein